MPENVDSPEVVALAVQLLSAYLANNTVPSEDLAGLIRTTRIALAEEATPAVAEPQVAVHTPAVSVRKSLASADHIISLIDGKRYKTLKRHLSAHGLTPDSYRERYNLPATYPMVAPSFAAVRRKIAEQIGLGGRKKAAKATASPASAPAEKAVKEPAAKPAKAKAAAKPKTVAKTAVAPASGSDAATAKAAPAPAPRKAKAAAKSPAGSVAAKNGAAAPEAKPAAEAPKRRGKLGLFKAANGSADKPAEPAQSAASETAKAAAKPATRRRTARPPAPDAAGS